MAAPSRSPCTTHCLPNERCPDVLTQQHFHFGFPLEQDVIAPRHHLSNPVVSRIGLNNHLCQKVRCHYVFHKSHNTCCNELLVVLLFETRWRRSRSSSEDPKSWAHGTKFQALFGTMLSWTASDLLNVTLSSRSTRRARICSRIQPMLPITCICRVVSRRRRTSSNKTVAPLLRT